MSDAHRGAPETPLKRAIGTKLLLVFVIGDVLGAGIYALVGQVTAEVGGAVWAAFTAALLLATLTAYAYAELVTKYPLAAGSALYVNRAFDKPFFTFMVAFAVMCSGIASAATLSRAFAGDYFQEFANVNLDVVALGFILVVAALNLRGISESVKVNVALTAVEVTGLLLIVAVGVAALAQGDADFSRNFEFREGESVVAVLIGGASLAFYALIGFEDAVNVAEETKNPSYAFPRALFIGLAVAGVIYLLVTLTASMVVATDVLAQSDGALLEVVRRGPLGIPSKLFSFIALLAVANGALINMIMASRLVYGMSRQGIVPRAFGRTLAIRRTPHIAIAFTTVLAMALIVTGDLSSLADTTVILLLGVFVIVNVTVLVLRRDPVDHDHFRAPTAVPVVGGLVALYLLYDKFHDDSQVFLRALLLLALGAGLWAVNRLLGGSTGPVDAKELAG